MRCWHSLLALKLMLLLFRFGDPTAVGATAEGQKNGHISVIRLLLFFSWLALFFVCNFPLWLCIT
jgi:hypothetical protein